MTRRETTCLLCGTVSNDVAIGLIEWLNPVGRDRYTAAPRCRDKNACRSRVEGLGDAWEVRDPYIPTRELVEAHWPVGHAEGE